MLGTFDKGDGIPHFALHLSTWLVNLQERRSCAATVPSWENRILTGSREVAFHSVTISFLPIMRHVWTQPKVVVLQGRTTSCGRECQHPPHTSSSLDCYGTFLFYIFYKWASILFVCAGCKCTGMYTQVTSCTALPVVSHHYSDQPVYFIYFIIHGSPVEAHGCATRLLLGS